MGTPEVIGTQSNQSGVLAIEGRLYVTAGGILQYLFIAYPNYAE
jgi:hypothetical protein